VEILSKSKCHCFVLSFRAPLQFELRSFCIRI
jgi:hypothetical protein